MATRYAKFYIHKPDPTAIPDVTDTATALALPWEQACVVDVSFDGSYEEEDVSDSCSDGNSESFPTFRNTEISFDAFKKRTGADELPQWYIDLREAWQDREPVFLMMLDGPREDSGSEGLWILGNILNFKLTHPTKGGNKIEFTAKNAGTVTGVTKLAFLEVP